MEVKHKIKQSGTKMNISNAGKRVIRIKKMKNICTYTKKRKKKKGYLKNRKIQGLMVEVQVGVCKDKRKRARCRSSRA